MYLRMNSDEYGTEDFGPYSSLKDAADGMSRILTKAQELDDGVERWFRVVTDEEHEEAE